MGLYGAEVYLLIIAHYIRYILGYRFEELSAFMTNSSKIKN